jgi:hypothetical protein
MASETEEQTLARKARCLAASERDHPELSPLARLVYHDICAPEGKGRGRKNLTPTQVDLLRAYIQSPDGLPSIAVHEVPRAISAAEYLETTMGMLQEIMLKDATTDENKAVCARAMATCAKALNTVIGSGLIELAELIAPKKAVEAPKPKNKPPVVVGVQVNVGNQQVPEVPLILDARENATNG